MSDLEQWLTRNQAVALGISVGHLCELSKVGNIRRKRNASGALNVWLYAKEDVLQAINNSGYVESLDEVVALLAITIYAVVDGSLVVLQFYL